MIVECVGKTHKILLQLPGLKHLSVQSGKTFACQYAEMIQVDGLYKYRYGCSYKGFQPCIQQTNGRNGHNLLTLIPYFNQTEEYEDSQIH